MSSFKQKLHVLAVGATLGLGVTAAMLPSAANAALTWQYNNAAANAAEGYVPGGPFPMGPTSAIMDSLTFTAESIIAWHGVPFAPGSTFSDFIVVKVNDYRLANTPVSEINYGNGFAGVAPGDHQITLVIVANGTQVTTNTFAANGLNFRMNWYWDSGCDPALGACAGVPYTYTNFSTLANVTDGTLVETSTFVSGNGANTTVGLPDGTIDLIVGMVDNLGGSGPGLPPDFELMTGTFALQSILGVAAGNNALCTDQGGTRPCVSTTASMIGFFTPDIIANGGFGSFTTFVHTQTEGSFIKLAAVPEPGTMLLLGAGLAGLGFGASRKKKAAA